MAEQTPEQVTLEHIKAYRPPKKTPPIAKLTYALYEKGGFKLDEASVEEIRAALRAKHGNLKELTDELCGLAAFIMYAMELRNDPVVAEIVANLIKEQRSEYEELGRSLQPLLQDLAKHATGMLEKFTGAEDPAKARAPKFGEEAPAGALPLSKIKPLAQPPPPRIKPPKPSKPKKK